MSNEQQPPGPAAPDFDDDLCNGIDKAVTRQGGFGAGGGTAAVGEVWRGLARAGVPWLEIIKYGALIIKLRAEGKSLTEIITAVLEAWRNG